MNVRAYMRNWISVKIPSGTVTQAADTVYDSVVKMKARVTQGNDLVFAADGSEKTANHTIVTMCEIPVGSLVWIHGVDALDLDGAARRVQDSQVASIKSGRYSVYIAVV